MGNWVSVWGQAHTDISMMSPVYKNNTTRLVFRCSLSGTQFRVRFSNREGKKLYKIVQALVSHKGQNQKQMLFQAKEQVTVAPGEEICSDSLSYTVTAGELLQLDIAFEGKVRSENNIPAVVHGSPSGMGPGSIYESGGRRCQWVCYGTDAEPTRVVYLPGGGVSVFQYQADDPARGVYGIYHYQGATVGVHAAAADH